MAEKLVVFDLDGTLLDTLDDIRGAVNYALNAWSVPSVDRESMRIFVGHGLRNALFTALKESKVKVDECDLPLMVELMLSSYRNHPSDHTRPYDGITDMLSLLFSKGFKVGIISNKSDVLVKRIVSDILPSFPFDFVLGQCDDFPLKPDPASLLYMIKKYGAEISSTLYVGDSEVDKETAERAGVASFIVNYGFRTKDELEAKGICATVSTVKELEEKILSFFDR